MTRPDRSKDMLSIIRKFDVSTTDCKGVAYTLNSLAEGPTR